MFNRLLCEGSHLKEIWKPIPGYLNYKVSNFGRVKSIQMIATNGRRQKGTLLSPCLCRGYPTVVLCQNGVHKHKSVHRAVMEAFRGECPEGYQVNHIDEDRTNNHISNLEYVTRKQNMTHGTLIERSARARLNHPKMSKPVECYSKDGKLVCSYPSGAEASRRTGINRGNIGTVCRKEHGVAGGYIWRFAEGRVTHE